MTLERAYLISINLELDSQHRGRNVVDQVRSADAIATARAEAPAAIGIVGLSNGVRGRIDDCSQVGEILYGGRGESCWHDDDAGEEHIGQKVVCSGVL